MGKDNVIGLKKPETINDLLTEVLRSGARKLLAAAVNAEVEEFLSQHNSEEGIARFVRNGYLPEREIQTGIGDVAVQVPRVRDRMNAPDEIRFGSSVIPKYLRRSGNMNDLLPLLYLKGISSNDFADALKPLVGDEARNLSPGVIGRLKAVWEDEYQTWRQRDLSGKRYVYFWADGIHLQARLEDSVECVLVIIGVTEQGNKELLTIEGGHRESKQSWLSVLQDLKNRGLKKGPKLAVGDGALGFWGALTEAYGKTRHQRCWFHKMGNVLDKLPKSLQAKAKSQLQDIWMSDTREAAYKAFNHFVSVHEAKYFKATECLLKDKEELLAFYDFPAEHWAHIRTSNPIESTFATVRHRTYKSKGCFSRTTILTMVFKLCESAQKRWHRLRGFNYLADVIRDVKFTNGIRQEEENGSVNERAAA
ncbi:MAG: IS256 family transposase [Gammaproteobacteria bacterium]